MRADQHDLTLKKGSADRLVYVYEQADGTKPDLSAWSARMVARRSKSPSASLVFDISSDDAITLGADGAISVTITSAVAAGLKSGWYELWVTPPASDSYVIVQGALLVEPSLL